MFRETLATGLLVTITLALAQAQRQGVCKSPEVEKRLLADDVRYASPFYVIALPRNPRTEQMDNVCYTYYENNGAFFHVMSITYKNGSNTFYTYSKGDIADRMGLAEGSALADSPCVYHDHTLVPICNVTVFVLYRCFIDGSCGDIDIGITPGVDVRVVLAANPIVSPECRRETEANLKDTTTFSGGDYVILPQRRKPQCITKYNNMMSIGHERSVGSKEVSEDDLIVRFGGGQEVKSSGAAPASAMQSPSQSQPQQAQSPWANQNGPLRNPAANQPNPPTNSFNPYGTSVKGQAGSQGTVRPGYTPAPAWTQNNGQWNPGPAPSNGQTIRPGSENHFHIWQSPTGTTKTAMGKNPNVFYHIHSWENPPPGCCKCN